MVMGAESRHGLARVAHPPVASRVASHGRGARGVPAPAPPAGATAMRRHLHRPGATDLSADGNRAVGFAYALLAGHGGVVELCHVHERALPSPAYAYDVPRAS